MRVAGLFGLFLAVEGVGRELEIVGRMVVAMEDKGVLDMVGKFEGKDKDGEVLGGEIR